MQVLSWLSFDKSSVGGQALHQARILAFYYWATYSILKARKPCFQQLQQPKEGDEQSENDSSHEDTKGQQAAVTSAAS